MNLNLAYKAWVQDIGQCKFFFLRFLHYDFFSAYTKFIPAHAQQ